jgi:peptide/nickel transport system ATP-binding protein
MSTSSLLLSVRDLVTELDSGSGVIRPLDGVSFDVRRHETFALLGESGCGKSMTALSIMRLLPDTGRVTSGTVTLGDTELTVLPESDMRDIRGRRAAMIFQEPMLSLNPVMTIGDQIAETLERHTDLRGDALSRRAVELLDAVRIPDAANRLADYPFQLSGGMKQRVMIAVALACDPELLIADEPTTALDVTIQAQILDLLRTLQRERGMALLLITHDLAVVAEMAHTVAVMYAGQIVEAASREQFFATPVHPYSQKLFASLPDRRRRGSELAVIRGSVPPLTSHFVSCRFADRCDRVADICRREAPLWDGAPEAGVRCHLPATVASIDATSERSVDEARHGAGEKTLTIQNLTVHFPVRKGLFQRTVASVRAVDGVSLDIAPGETLGLVGESGCGKTTIGKAIVRLVDPTGGTVRYGDLDLASATLREVRPVRKDVQIIFQDPYSSLNPRMRVLDTLEEGMSALGVGADAREREARVDRLLADVGLAADAKYRYPHEFSGGQRQRIAIARALSVEPRLIICDEPTSALDVSVQAQILNLLRDLQQQRGLAYLFITHNISVVEFIAHRVAVMYLGRIVEEGPVDAVLQNPQHPYTRSLLSAVPTLESTGRQIIRLSGDLPSPVSPPAGCHFHPRCPDVMDVCRETYPASVRVGEHHLAACHRCTGEKPVTEV